MMKTIVLLALVAMASAQCGNNFQDEGERGVDCGTDVGGVATSCGPCTCITDLTRDIFPPTLINDNINSTGSGETGLSGSILQIAIDVDEIVEINGAQGVRYTGATFFNGPSASYFTPYIAFVDNNGADKGTVLTSGTCTRILDFTNDVTAALGTYDAAGTGTMGCGTRQLRFSFPAINAVINNCEWVESTQQDITGLTFPADVTDDQSPAYTPLTGAFTVFEGVFKLFTSQYGGLLAGLEEVAFSLESGFTIQVVIQETVTVTSGAIQVIGAATNQSAITHQIWNTDTSVVDINALVGVSYPAAPSIFGPDVTLGTGPTRNLVTFQEACNGRDAYLVNGDIDPAKRIIPAGSEAACTAATPAQLEACMAAAYTSTTGEWCDADCSGSCDLNDFFTHDDATTPTLVQQGALIADYAPKSNGDPQDLFDTRGRCPGGDDIVGDGTGAGAAAGDGDACLSNIHIRLKPRAGWCDLNFDLRLQVGVVCRDDLNGDGGVPTGDSIIDLASNPAGGIGGLYDTRTPGSEAFADPSFTCTTSTLPSTDTQTNGGGGGIDFSIASDNFCPQLIYTASLEGQMSVYDSPEWGANCAATGLADCDAAFDLAGTIPDTPFDLQNCVQQTVGTGLNEGFCRSAPGRFADSQTVSPSTTGNTATRKSQNTFVFGQTMYVETRVVAEAGVNIAATAIREMWTAAQALDEYDDLATAQGPAGSPTAANWAQRLFTGRALNAAVPNTTPLAGFQSTAQGAATSVNPSTIISVQDTLISGQGTATALDEGRMTYGDGTLTSPANDGIVGSFGNRLGRNYEGVSRATIVASDETIYTANLQTASTPTTIWAVVDVTYIGASSQVAQNARSVQTASIPAGAGNRARLSALTPVTGGSVGNAQVGVRAGSTAGAGGSASTIAGFSSTTVLAAAVVLGAVVAVAAAGFFVQRKRAQPTAKTTSSSLELNDAAMTQA